MTGGKKTKLSLTGKAVAVTVREKCPLKHPDCSDKEVVHVVCKSKQGPQSLLDLRDTCWFLERLHDECSVRGVVCRTDEDRDEAAVVGDSPDEAAVAGAELPPPPYTTVWDFRGAWVAKVSKEGPLKGKEVKMSVSSLTRAKWMEANAKHDYGVQFAGAGPKQKKEWALDYLRLTVDKLLEDESYRVGPNCPNVVSPEGM